jgi:hypothetical protein
VVHDGGVGKDPPRRQKRLPFKSAPATWLEATRASGCDAESEWKALPSEEQRAIKAVADAAAKHQENVAKSEAKAAKRAAQQVKKAVAAGTTAKSARAVTSSSAASAGRRAAFPMFAIARPPNARPMPPSRCSPLRAGLLVSEILGILARTLFSLLQY